METENHASLRESGIHSKFNNWLNYSIVVLAFVVPLSRSGISIMIFVIPLLWIAEGGWNFKWKKIKKDRLIQAIVAYIGFVCLSLLWTDNYSEAVANAKNYGHLIIIPIMLTSLRNDFRLKVINAYASGILALLILTILNYSGIILIAYNDVYYHVVEHMLEPTPYVFMHSLDYSMFLAWTVIFGIYFLHMLLKEKNKGFVEKKQLYLWPALILSCLIWIFIQPGRSGQFAMIVALPFLTYFILKERNKILFFTITGVFILLLIAQYRWNPGFKDRVKAARLEIHNSLKNKEYTSSLGNRILAHEIAWQMIKKSWLVGYGIGDNMDIFSEHVETLQKEMEEKKMPRLSYIYQITTNHMHSQYLQVLTETGIIGLILFLGIYFVFIVKSVNREIAFLLIILFFTGFIGEPFMRNQFTSALICLFMGLIYSASVCRKNEFSHYLQI
jgi:O-antigen ligase